MDTVKALQAETSLTGWRKIKHIQKAIKSKFRKASHQVFAGKNETQKKEATKDYLQQVAEWIYKGKKNKPVELGHLLLITTDQFQFIIDHHIMEGQKDATQIKPLQERLNKNFSHANMASHSFDKGFWSKDNLEILQAGTTKQVVLPKRGKHTQADQERESDENFKAKRNAHSAIESNINMLEHHGLNRCMDKGMRGYKRCTGLSILSYNLHILGNALQARQRREAEKAVLRQAA